MDRAVGCGIDAVGVSDLGRIGDSPSLKSLGQVSMPGRGCVELTTWKNRGDSRRPTVRDEFPAVDFTSAVAAAGPFGFRLFVDGALNHSSPPGEKS